MFKKNGFALVELLVVISIIAILSVIGSSSFTSIKDKVAEAKKRADIDAIKKVYETKFDPSLNGGQGGYKPLTDNDFASGKIPTPYEGGSYFVVGPEFNSGRVGDSGFTVCASLSSNSTCLPGNPECICKSSAQQIATVISQGVSASSATPGIEFDNASSSSATALSKTISHTTSGTNRLMIVGVSIRGNDPVSSITYGGKSFSKIRADTAGVDVRSELWYLVDPPTGTNDVVVTLSWSQNFVVGVTTWNNVSQSTPLGANAGANHGGVAGRTAAVNIASSDTNVVVDIAATQNAGATLTPNTSQISRWNKVGGAGVGAGSSKTGGPTTTMSWTLSFPEYWTVSAVSLVPAQGRGVPNPTVAPTPVPTQIPAAISEVTKKVLIISLNPILENHGGQRLNQYMGWGDPIQKSQELVTTFKQISHGFVNFTIVDSKELDLYPVISDGFQYTDETYLACRSNNSTCHKPEIINYQKFITDQGFCEKRNNDEIDEVWVWGGGWFGFWESNLTGPGAYWLNSGPTFGTTCTKLLPIMALNPERGQSEALESFAHRSESTMVKVYGGWAANESNAWNKFTLQDRQMVGHAGCGNAHFPANGQSDYDWSNTRTVVSKCDDFLNYPNLQGTTTNVSCSTWNCNSLQYFKYWYSHFPHVSGTGSDGKLNNWWEYIIDPVKAL